MIDAKKLAREIGADAWARLVAWKGGVEYAVPVRMESEAGKRLAIRIGEVAAEKVIGVAGGLRIYIAGRDCVAEDRYRAVYGMHLQGKTSAEIAAEFSYTERYTPRRIQQIIDQQQGKGQ